jgi:phosphate transport system protein
MTDPLTWLEGDDGVPRGGRAAFQAQLQRVDDVLIHLGSSVAGGIVAVTEAFLQADHHGAGVIVERHFRIDADCTALEEHCYVLLARQAPVASDLRRLVAVLRSVQDVQRSANLLRHVASSLTWVHPPSMPDDLRGTISSLGEVSAEIFAAGVAAWRTHDALAANDLEERDDQVDLLQKWLLTELYTGRRTVEEAVSLALIARYYERVADHAVEMARHVAYFLTGDRLTPSPR